MLFKDGTESCQSLEIKPHWAWPLVSTLCEIQTQSAGQGEGAAM